MTAVDVYYQLIMLLRDHFMLVNVVSRKGGGKISVHRLRGGGQVLCADFGGGGVQDFSAWKYENFTAPLVAVTLVQYCKILTLMVFWGL